MIFSLFLFNYECTIKFSIVRNADPATRSAPSLLLQRARGLLVCVQFSACQRVCLLSLLPFSSFHCILRNPRIIPFTPQSHKQIVKQSYLHILLGLPCDFYI